MIVGSTVALTTSRSWLWRTTPRTLGKSQKWRAMIESWWVNGEVRIWHREPRRLVSVCSREGGGASWKTLWKKKRDKKVVWQDFLKVKYSIKVRFNQHNVNMRLDAGADIRKVRWRKRKSESAALIRSLHLCEGRQGLVFRLQHHTETGKQQSPAASNQYPSV